MSSVDFHTHLEQEFIDRETRSQDQGKGMNYNERRHTNIRKESRRMNQGKRGIYENMGVRRMDSGRNADNQSPTWTRYDD